MTCHCPVRSAPPQIDSYRVFIKSRIESSRSPTFSNDMDFHRPHPSYISTGDLATRCLSCTPKHLLLQSDLCFCSKCTNTQRKRAQRGRTWKDLQRCNHQWARPTRGQEKAKAQKNERFIKCPCSLSHVIKKGHSKSMRSEEVPSTACSTACPTSYSTSLLMLFG